MRRIKHWLKKFRRLTPCIVCGKPLLSQASRAAGMGPTCRKKNPTLAYQRGVERQGQMRLNMAHDRGENE